MLSSDHFKNISQMVCFLDKTIYTYFVANLSSFQENFKFQKSVGYWQSYA